MRLPNSPRLSETVPIGHSQEQNDFFTATDIAMMAMRMTVPAGWIRLRWPLLRKYQRLINALIGRNPSTPGGRWIGDPPVPAFQEYHRVNSTPIQMHSATNAICIQNRMV